VTILGTSISALYQPNISLGIRTRLIYKCKKGGKYLDQLGMIFKNVANTRNISASYQPKNPPWYQDQADKKIPKRCNIGAVVFFFFFGGGAMFCTVKQKKKRNKFDFFKV
jgi:hypothetical protein